MGTKHTVEFRQEAVRVAHIRARVFGLFEGERMGG